MTRKPKPNNPKEIFRTLNAKQKIQYIWDYYKLQLVILCIAVYVAGTLIYSRATHKDVVLYTAFVNVTAGDTFSSQISDGFLDYMDLDTGKNTFELYTGLYFKKDASGSYPEDAYASQIKILGSISAKQLDVVLMDRESFDTLSKRGFLINLEELLSQKDPTLYEQLKPCLVSNTVILTDNSLEADLDPSVEYSAETDEYPMAIDLSEASEFASQAGFEDTVYLGIIGNSPRTDTVLQYLEYLTNDPS